MPLVAAFAAAWLALAPPQYGGATSYAITEGSSMLPSFHAGDLVLLRKQSSYHVGEVAGYHNPMLGVVVMHRIVAQNGNHFVFKGDHNTWVDPYEPASDQIVGAEWVHLSRFGRLLAALRTPIVTAVLLGLLWLFAFWPRTKSRTKAM